MPSIALLAGEPSGDHHGGALARALRRRLPGVRLVGLGGPAMEAEGVELLAGLEDLAVMGFAEVVKRLGFFRKLERRVRGMLVQDRIDLVIPIDYPGFNLRAARHAHGLGIPVLYYIAPQVWAWRAGRIRTLTEVSRHVAVILPFEVEVFRTSPDKVSFVGHPLLERPDDVDDDTEFRTRWSLPAGRPILALLPGSRVQELERHLEVFVAAARILAASTPDLLPVVARAPSLPERMYEGVGCPVVDDSRALLRHARAALVKSGTSTLEAALEGTPFVMAYRTSPLTWQIARRVIRVDHVALANLVAGARVVPELLQEQATPERMAKEVRPLLDTGSAARQRQLEGLARIRGALGGAGASERVAELAAGLLEERH